MQEVFWNCFSNSVGLETATFEIGGEAMASSKSYGCTYLLFQQRTTNLRRCEQVPVAYFTPTWSTFPAQVVDEEPPFFPTCPRDLEVKTVAGAPKRRVWSVLLFLFFFHSPHSQSEVPHPEGPIFSAKITMGSNAVGSIFESDQWRSHSNEFGKGTRGQFMKQRFYKCGRVQVQVI